MELRNLTQRIVILCSCDSERQMILEVFEAMFIKRISKNETFELAPHIDFSPQKHQYQTITNKSFVLSIKNINFINAKTLIK